MEQLQVLRRAVELLDGAGYPCERLAMNVHLHLEDLCALGLRRGPSTQPTGPDQTDLPPGLTKASH